MADFPIAIQLFANRLVGKVADFRWHLARFQEVSGTAGGHVITAQIAAPKWQVFVPFLPLKVTEAADIQATIELLEGYGSVGTFDLFDLRKAGAVYDPDGSIIDGESPTLNAVGTRTLRVGDLPPSYVLTRGDMISIPFGSPARRALYRVLETTTANGAGSTTHFEVEPAVKIGTVVGNAVGIYKPRARMMIQPGSFSPGSSEGRFVTGMSFTAIEAF
jgi:hypothetical protein